MKQPDNQIVKESRLEDDIGQLTSRQGSKLIFADNNFEWIDDDHLLQVGSHELFGVGELGAQF